MQERKMWCADDGRFVPGFLTSCIPKRFGRDNACSEDLAISCRRLDTNTGTRWAILLDERKACVLAWRLHGHQIE